MIDDKNNEFDDFDEMSLDDDLGDFDLDGDLDDDSLSAEGFDDTDVVGEGFEDDGFSEDWDDDAIDSADQPAKSSSSKFSASNMIIMGGALLVGGFFFYTQMSGGNDATPPVPVQQQAEAVATIDESQYRPALSQRDIMMGRDKPVIEQEEEELGLGLVDDPSLVFEQPNEGFNLGALDDEQSFDEAPPMPQAMEQDDGGPLTPMPSFDMGNDPSPDDMAAENDDFGFGAGPETVSGDSANPPSFGNQATVSDQKLNQLFDRLDAVEGRLENIAVSAQPANMDDIQKSMDDLEKRLEKTIERTIDRRLASGKTVSSSTSRPKAAKSTPKTNSVKRSSSPTRRSSARSVKQWELRGASPGKAFVAERGKDDMREVTVGESLSGIGKVKSIQYVNNLWVIQGTQGRITQ